MNGLKTTPVHTKIGPVTFPKGTGEGDLDVEWLMGMAPGYVLFDTDIATSRATSTSSYG